MKRYAQNHKVFQAYGPEMALIQRNFKNITTFFRRLLKHVEARYLWIDPKHLSLSVPENLQFFFFNLIPDPLSLLKKQAKK